MTSLKLVLNGRFFRRNVTGVERLALELSLAIRAVLAEIHAIDASFEVVAPSATIVDLAKITPAGLPPAALTMTGKRSGHVWEQLELPGFAPDGWLLNFCNTAPMLRRHQAVIICDAQFILHPESYSRGFRWWYRVLLSVAGRRTRAVFTISEYSRAQLEKYRVLPAGKAHVLRLGVDHVLAIPPDPSILVRRGLQARAYILATGSLARHKNLATLVQAFKAANLDDVDLVVAGGGNARVFGGAGFESASNIHFLGRVTDGELRALYAHAMAFACPSLTEGFGFTPLEAMTAGCPVVATTGGAVPEVCGDAALYANPLDVDEWRDALRLIAHDEGLRADLSKRGLARSQGFRWRETARQVLQVLAREQGDSTALAALEAMPAQAEKSGGIHPGQRFA